MHKSRLASIIIDCRCTDLQVAARFWSAALGCPLPPAAVDGHERYIQLQTRPGEVRVLLQRVDHPSHVHLDIESSDIDAEVRRLEGLGARVVARHAGWTVMQAPSGQRFCVGAPCRAGFEAAATRWE